MLTIGSTFQGQYSIVSELGDGTHGLVYEAFQLSTGQRVAIKLMRLLAQGMAAEDVDRFEQERRLCAELHHPNIVRLIDAGRTTDGWPYTVVEHVPGLTLRQLLAREGKLTTLDTCHLMGEVLDALCCAHRQQVVHRDLKPHNVMVAATGARRHAMILDFGIGHKIRCRAEHEGRGTSETADFFGTPGYASPEQLRGLEPTAVSDVYSWGLTLVECLTGTPVFSGTTSDIVFEQLGPKPVPLPEAIAGHPLEKVVSLALQKDASRRCGAETLLRELEQCEARLRSSSGRAVGTAVPCEAKGATDAVPSTDVERRPSPTSRPTSVSGDSRRRASCVGRDAELDILLKLWTRVRQGAGQACMISGEAGIGKSRLIRELRTAIGEQGPLLVEVGCVALDQNNALSPIRELLAQLLQLEPGVDPAVARQHLQTALERGGLDSPSVFPVLGQLLGLPSTNECPPQPLSPAHLRERSFTMLVRLLSGLANLQPILLVMEDLQWADPTTIDFLGVLTRELLFCPLLALFSARSELASPLPTTGITHLCLERLSAERCGQLADQLAGDRALSAEEKTWIWERTEGVPFFVEEFVDGVMRDRERAHNAESFGLPSTLRDLLGARLDQAGCAKQTAQLASVLGREFPCDVLMAVHPEEASVVQTHLQMLAEADIVYCSRRTRNPRYAFRHSLIRDAAYESLPTATREHTHGLVASALEHRFPEMAKARPDLLAHHHMAAGHAREAVAWAIQASQHALEHAAFREAKSQLEAGLSGLERLPHSQERDQSELELRSLLLFALLSGGHNPQDLRVVAERCYRAADRVPDGPNIAPSLWRIALYCIHTDRPRAFQTGERLLRCAREMQDVGQEVALMSITGNCMVLEARYAEALGRAEATLRLYDQKLHRDNAYKYGIDSKVHGHILLALVHELQGDCDRAAAEAEAGVAWAKEIQHPTSLGNALIHLGSAHQALGDRERVLAITTNALDLAQRHGLDFVRMFCGMLRCWAERSTAGVEQWLELMRRSGLQGGSTYWLGVAAETHFSCGDCATALERVGEALERVETMGEVYQLPELLRLKAVYLFHSVPADDDRPKDYLRQALEVAKRHGAKSSERRSLAVLEQWSRVNGPELELAVERNDPGATTVFPGATT